MVWGGRVFAAMSVAVEVVLCCICWPTCPSWAGDDDERRAILFSGRDLWFNGAFAYGGMIWSPRDLDEDGLLFKLLLSGGLYRYNAGDLGNERVVGAEWLVQALPGWHVKRGTFEAKVFWGPEFQHHRLWPDDPGNTLKGGKFGLRFSTEFWYEPTTSTMITADGSLSTIGGSNSARLGLGWKFFDQFYSGPETQIYGGAGYSQWRLGVHFTSLKTGEAEWSAAGGWARDTNNRSSPYFRLGFMQRLAAD
jgi:hypothetical protein